MEAQLDMNDHRITNLAAPVNGSDAARLTDVLTVAPGTNVANFLSTPSSANLAAALTDETGTGLAVFNTSPSLTTPVITGGTITGITDLAVADGGTGASTAANARTNLGLGTMATQAASAVAITGGTVTGITDIAVADGGTGASTAANARTNLGLAIGTDVQAYDADLAAIAALTSAADRVPYATGSNTWSLATLTSFARTLLATATNSAFLAALGQIASSVIDFINSGTGAVTRTLQAWLRERAISVKDFGAVGDGTTDDAAAFNAALTASVGALAGRAVYVPGSNARYKIGSTIAVPGGATLFGDGPRSSSFLIKAFNGTFLTLADGSNLQGLRMDGAGATRTGKGIEHTGGNQIVRDLFLYDTEDTAVYFTTTSGANCHYENVTAYVYGSTTATNKWAFKIQDLGSAVGGTPRHFVNIKTAGAESFDFGAGNNVLISASALYDLKWSTSSRNVAIAGCRIASTAQLDIYGSGSIVGCDLGSKAVLQAGSVYCLGPNIYNNSWEDLSGGGDNLVYSINDITYTPVCSAAGVPITLGNGTITGVYSREGRTIRAMIRLLPGTTTSFGAGQLSFTLPQATSFAYNQVDCHGRFEATSGTMYRINGRIAASGSTVLLERDTTGSVTSTAPGTMASTGAITMTVVYDV